MTCVFAKFDQISFILERFVISILSDNWKHSILPRFGYDRLLQTFRMIEVNINQPPLFLTAGTQCSMLLLDCRLIGKTVSFSLDTKHISYHRECECEASLNVVFKLLQKHTLFSVCKTKSHFFTL